jgi:GNAT superfamily N-acetyltransferase
LEIKYIGKSKEELKEFMEIEGNIISENELQNPDHLILLFDGAEKVGRVALWEKENNVMYFGHLYVKDNNEKSQIYISTLMNSIEKVSKEEDFKKIIGPINKNTWNKYRLVKKNLNDKINPFFLEVTTPINWYESIVSCGYSNLATYYSSIIEDASSINNSVSNEKTFEIEQEYYCKDLNDLKFEDMIDIIYETTVRSFKDNYLYEEITKEEFIILYTGIEKYLVKEMMIIIYERNTGEPVGYAFGIPEFNELLQTGKTERSILKTLGILENHQGKGLGTYLVNKFSSASIKNGFSSIILAFMHESNHSKQISDKSANIIREYALLVKGI